MGRGHYNRAFSSWLAGGGVKGGITYGATDDLGTGPTGSLARVIREPVDCSPCLKRECPIDHRCMTRVSADRVAGVALELIKRDGA